MSKKRNPIKQIMSEVHKDARAGRIALGDHDGFISEVRRRLAAAGLRDSDMPAPGPGKAGSAKRGSHTDHAERE